MGDGGESENGDGVFVRGNDPHNPTQSMAQSASFDSFLAEKRESDCIKQARVRQGAMAAAHLVVPPVVSVAYAVKTNNWMPTIAATGAAAICAFADAGLGFPIMSMTIPPATSALMIANKGSDARRRLGIVMPEQADKLLYEKGIY